MDEEKVAALKANALDPKSATGMMVSYLGDQVARYTILARRLRAITLVSAIALIYTFWQGVVWLVFPATLGFVIGMVFWMHYRWEIAFWSDMGNNNLMWGDMLDADKKSGSLV